MKSFTKTEWILWGGSILLIVCSFSFFPGGNLLSALASVIGVTSLILAAKGHPTGQALMILFSLLYGYISYRFSYYGEMITYLGMTLPMAVISLVSWLHNPFAGEKSEVAVNRLAKKEAWFLVFLTAAVTTAFGFLLQRLGTANLLPSTLSVATSFAAAYLTFRRSAYFAAVYALNDLVLIVLWILASTHDLSYLSVVICFAVFFINDIYGCIRWLSRRERQENLANAKKLCYSTKW